MYEHRTQKLLEWPAFLRRASTHVGWAVLIVIPVAAIGTVGYHWLGSLRWIDAFMNASMILGGMGPVDRLESDAAKLFAALYALFSGLVFVGLMGIVIAPWIHRLIHAVQAEERPR